MAEWITHIPNLTGAAATLVPSPGADNRKQDFWVSTIAQPTDPFFDVTSNLDTIVVAARETKIKAR